MASATSEPIVAVGSASKIHIYRIHRSPVREISSLKFRVNNISYEILNAVTNKYYSLQIIYKNAS